jgi:hypothetical protein
MHKWVLVIAAVLLTTAASRAAADDTVTLDDLEIFAVEDGEPARILFSAPSGLATRTLTADDLDVRVDGEPQPARLQRLSADDLQIAVVMDTTLDVNELRELQAAVVELALTLPQGATMRLIDAVGNVSDPAPVPGPAIAAIRALRPGTNNDIAAAVHQATALLDESSAGTSALLVVGRDLATRLDVVDERPLQSVSYLISIGSGRAADRLGPRTGGEAVAVDNAGDVLAVTDDIARDLSSLYVAEVSVPEGSTRAITFALATEEGGTRPITLALNPDSLQPAPAEPADRERPDTDTAAQPDTDAREEPAPSRASDSGATSGTARWLPWLAAAAVLIALIAAIALWLPRVLRRPAPTEPEPLPPALPTGPRHRRAEQGPSPPQRPIAKLAPETRQALAGAYRGLRRLAVASRDAAGIVPDDLFRLTEARASAALDGHDQPLDVVLYAALSADGADAGSSMVRRAATALSQGWQHTSRQASAPPAVVELNTSRRGTGGERRGTVAPVRALDPLVEIGLEHMVLAAKPDEHAALAARAVTVVDVMRAARLARPVLTLSPFLLTDVNRYRAACRADPVDAENRDDWLQFLFDGIARRAYVAVDQLGQLQRLRLRWRHTAPNPLCARLVDLLLTDPVIDTPQIAQRLALSQDQADAMVATAQAARWLEPYPDDDRVLVAVGVMDVFTSADTPADSNYYA